MTTRIIIARHGNTFAPDETPRRVGKHTDIPLVESGRHQAQRMARYLAHHTMTPDWAYSSTLQRTIAMVDIMNETNGWNVSRVALAFLDEIDYGVDENVTEAELVQRIGQDALDAWDKDAVPPSGWNVDPQRLRSQWRDFADYILNHQTDKTILAVTSNGIARFAPSLLEDEARLYKQHSIKMRTGALSILEHDGDSWHYTLWNHRPE